MSIYVLIVLQAFICKTFPVCIKRLVVRSSSSLLPARSSLRKYINIAIVMMMAIEAIVVVMALRTTLFISRHSKIEARTDEQMM